MSYWGNPTLSGMNMYTAPTGARYIYTGPSQNIMGHPVMTAQYRTPADIAAGVKSGQLVPLSGLGQQSNGTYGAGLNSGTSQGLSSLMQPNPNVGPSIEAIYGSAGPTSGTIGSPTNTGGAGTLPPTGYLPQFDLQAVMNNVAAHRASAGNLGGGRPYQGLPMGTLYNGMTQPSAGGIAALQNIAAGQPVGFNPSSAPEA